MEEKIKEEEIKIDNDNFGKSEDDINIDEIKDSKLLNIEEMEKILLSCKKTKTTKLKIMLAIKT